MEWEPPMLRPPALDGKARLPQGTGLAFEMVPPAGFEPAISTLKGWRPRPLDDGDSAKESIAENSCLKRRHKKVPQLAVIR